jgi:hypothetical protein
MGVIFLAIAILIGFVTLITWDVIWVFWLFGIANICMGVAAASDDRVRDRRFKTGFKGNEKDTSDIATGAKFITLGIIVCILAYFARQLFEWVVQASGISSIYWNLYMWKISAGLVVLWIAVVIVGPKIPTAKAEKSTPMEHAKDSTKRDSAAVHSSASDLKLEQDILRVLLYVGKADGQLRAPERSVIGSALMRLGSKSIDNPAEIDGLLANIEVPTKHAFKLAVGRLSRRDPSILQGTLSAARQIVATQKAVHVAEQEALDYLQSHVSRPT